MAAVPTDLPPLVNRQEEVARIAEALDAAERSEGRLLLLRGEAGSGKTRLAQEAMVQAERRGFGTGFGTALAESVTPYHPWVEALRSLELAPVLDEGPPPKLLGLWMLSPKGEIVAKAELPDERVPEAVSTLRALPQGGSSPAKKSVGNGPISVLSFGSVRAIFRRGENLHGAAVIEGVEDEGLFSDLRRLVRKMESMFAVPTRRGKAGTNVRTSAEAMLQELLDSGKYEGVDYARNDPKLRQARLFDRVLLGLTRRGDVCPQFIVIDDLQWADPSSLALLQYVARNAGGIRLLVVGTFRVEEAGARPHLRNALERMEQERLPAGLLLAGLPREEMQRLAEVFLGPHALPADFLDALWRETQGYPLFIREVLRRLEDDGEIRRRTGVKRLERSKEEVAIPRRVREAIRLRLENLPPEERRLLEAAAACGTRFTIALLAKVAGEEKATVVPRLDALARLHGLLRSVDDGFSFDHPAVREVAYGALNAETRRAHHLKAAEWLELVGGRLDDIAEHYYLAGDTRAVPALREVAHAAAESFANAEAIRFYREALELESSSAGRLDLIERLGAAQRLAGDLAQSLNTFESGLALAPDPITRSRIVKEMGRVYVSIGKYREALNVLNESLSLVRGKDVREESDVLRWIGHAASILGQTELGLESANRSLEVAERLHDDEAIANALSLLGILMTDGGRYQEAVSIMKKSLQVREKIGNRRGVSVSLNNIGVAHYERGDYARARKHYFKALAISEAIGDPDSQAVFHTNLGITYRFTGDFDKALEHHSMALEIAQKVGNQLTSGAVLGNLGNVYLSMGLRGEALRHFERALDMARHIGDKVGIACNLVNVGRVYHQDGDLSRALEQFRASLVVAEEVDARMRTAEALWCIGAAQKDLGALEDAQGNLERSLNVARECGLRSVQSEALRELAEVHLKRGNSQTAVDFGTRGLALAADTGDPVLVGSLRRVLGMIHRERQEFREAIENFDDGIQTLEKIGQPRELAESHFEFGLLWKATGDARKANTQFDAAEQLFTRLNLSRRLEKVGQARGQTPSSPRT